MRSPPKDLLVSRSRRSGAAVSSPARAENNVVQFPGKSGIDPVVSMAEGREHRFDFDSLLIDIGAIDPAWQSGDEGAAHVRLMGIADGQCLPIYGQGGEEPRPGLARIRVFDHEIHGKPVGVIGDLWVRDFLLSTAASLARLAIVSCLVQGKTPIWAAGRSILDPKEFGFDSKLPPTHGIEVLEVLSERKDILVFNPRAAKSRMHVFVRVTLMGGIASVPVGDRILRIQLGHRLRKTLEAFLKP